MTLTSEDLKICAPPVREDPKGGWDLEIRLEELQKPLDFNQMFGRKAPIEIEIGSGSGVFLKEEARRRPEVNFLGIEKDGKQAHRAKDKWRRFEIYNTRMLRCDAHYFLEEYPQEHSVDAYIILYSDPWFKKRHHKRRLFQPRLLPILQKTLKPGGLLTIKTDVSSYYDVIIELFEGCESLDQLFDKRLDLEPEEHDIETNFQLKARQKGHPLHYMQYRKK